MLRGEHGVNWPEDLLRTHHAFRVNGKTISPAQALEPRKIANITTAILQRKATFTDTMSGLLSQTRTFGGIYNIFSVSVFIMDIAGDRISPKFLAINSQSDLHMLHQSWDDDDQTQGPTSSAYRSGYTHSSGKHSSYHAP